VRVRRRRAESRAAEFRRRRDLLTSSDWRFVLFRAKLGFDRHHGLDQAAALTYLSFLALFPLTLTAVSALAIAVGRPNADAVILAVVSAVAPPEGVEALRGPLSQLSTIPLPGVALGVGIALGLWSISAYAACFGRTVNNFYEVEEGRTFWRMRLVMLLLSVPLAAGGAVVGAIILSTPRIGRAVARQAANRPEVADPLNLLWQFGKWPLLLLILALMLGGLYRWTPNVRRRNISPISWGAFVAIAGWTLFTAGFAVYVTGLAGYHVYGWLTGALVITLYLFLSNLVLVFGASIDTEVARLRQLREGIEAEVVIKSDVRSMVRTRRLALRTAEAEAAGRDVRRGWDRMRREERDAAYLAEVRARLGPLGPRNETPALGRPAVYRGAMAVATGRPDPDETPSEASIEQDFTTPADADYAPGADDEAGTA
jgi:membrane protein